MIPAHDRRVLVGDFYLALQVSHLRFQFGNTVEKLFLFHGCLIASDAAYVGPTLA